MKNLYKKVIQRLKNVFMPDDMRQRLQKLLELETENYITRTVLTDRKYQDEKHLRRFESHSYSQHGEDGIIAEIFNRIGTTNKVGVEFGAENGLETNTTLLLLREWRVHWVEISERHVQDAKRTFASWVLGGRLSIHQEALTQESINTQFQKFQIPKDIDLLSIDIDGNDYWLWEALEYCRPRVVVIEYNALHPPPISSVAPYTTAAWDKSSYYGASLSSLSALAKRKGYLLVACDFSGTNAFFVRKEAAREHFIHAGDDVRLYEPARHFLTYATGYRRAFGPFQTDS